MQQPDAAFEGDGVAVAGASVAGPVEGDEAAAWGRDGGDWLKVAAAAAGVMQANDGLQGQAGVFRRGGWQAWNGCPGDLEAFGFEKCEG